MNIFAITELPEETVAMAFAQYSRNPGSLRDVVQQDPAKFHAKWVLEYGHSSIAEHAVVHLAIEDVSILAAKAIEDCRLCSFTEKSTRYVRMDRVAHDDCMPLLEEYNRLFPLVHAKVQDRKRTCDLLRGLLPSGTLTNLGLTCNARELGHMIGKLKRSKLPEVQAIGKAMHVEAAKVAPTLLRHVQDTSPMNDAIEACQYPAVKSQGSAVRLLSWDADARTRIELACGELPLESVAQLRGEHEQLPRGFEASSITVSLELDYGAWRDLQRHRLMSQFPRVLTCHLGYDPEPELDDLGFGASYRDALDRARERWDMADDLYMAQYLVPLAYKTQVLCVMNLREAAHLIELRSKPQGHASYRRVVRELYDELVQAQPWLAGMIRITQP